MVVGQGWERPAWKQLMEWINVGSGVAAAANFFIFYFFPSGSHNHPPTQKMNCVGGQDCWRCLPVSTYQQKKHLWSSGDVPCRRLNVIGHGGSGQCSNSTGVEFSMSLVLKFQFDRPKLSKIRLMSQSNHLIDVMWFELSLIKYCGLVWYGVD